MWVDGPCAHTHIAHGSWGGSLFFSLVVARESELSPVNRTPLNRGCWGGDGRRGCELRVTRPRIRRAVVVAVRGRM